MESAIVSQPYEPHDLLKPYVTTYLYNQVMVAEEAHTIDLFPVGHSVLSFSMDDLPLYFEGRQVVSNYNITGQLVQHFRMRSVKGHYKTIMVLLKPFGAYRLFGTRQDTLVNTFEDLNHIHSSFHATDAVLKNITDPQEMIKCIDTWLLGLLQASSPSSRFLVTEQLCTRMMKDNGHAVLHELYDEYNISKSTAERYFKEMIGITPKLFNRITRFNYAYHTICNSLYKNWMDVVSDHGYFDQAHFIKEFKSFFGHTPSQLHQSMLNIAGHVKNIEISQQP